MSSVGDAAADWSVYEQGTILYLLHIFLGATCSDALAQRLIEFSQLRNEFVLNREKFEKFLKPTFFDSKLIFAASDEDLSMLGNNSNAHCSHIYSEW